MIKKTITFTDFNGVKKTEDHYFNLTRTEVIEMELSNDGYADAMDRLVKAPSGAAIMKEMKKFLLGAYGIKTADGRFEKSQEIRDRFESSKAYDEFFIDFVMDDVKAAQFINEIFPPDLVEAAQKARDNRAATDARKAEEAGVPEGGVAYGMDAREQFAQQQYAQAEARRQANLAHQQQYPPTYQAPIVPTTPPAQQFAQETPQEYLDGQIPPQQVSPQVDQSSFQRDQGWPQQNPA